MAKYRLSSEAKADLIRIHHYGVGKFGIVQADKYFDAFFDNFEIIAQSPFSFSQKHDMVRHTQSLACVHRWILVFSLFPYNSPT